MNIPDNVKQNINVVINDMKIISKGGISDTWKEHSESLHLSRLNIGLGKEFHKPVNELLHCLEDMATLEVWGWAWEEVIEAALELIE